MIARRWPRYALPGALALALVQWALSDTPRPTAGERARPVPPAPSKISRAPAPLPSLQLDRLQPREAPANTEQLAANTFTAMTWHVPPPPPKPVASPPPPPPSAPPMPFTFLGRYEDEGKLTIMLVKAGRIYTVAEGDVIEQTWRIDGLAAGQLELTYLPLDIRQTIAAGGS